MLRTASFVSFLLSPLDGRECGRRRRYVRTARLVAGRVSAMRVMRPVKRGETLAQDLQRKRAFSPLLLRARRARVLHF